MPKLKTKVKSSKVAFKPKKLVVKISEAFSSKKSKEMSTSRERTRRMTMAELLEEEKTQLQHIYCKSLSLKDMVETRGEEEGGKTVKQSKKKVRESTGKQSLSTASLSLSNFLRKKTRFSFTKWKINRKKNVNADEKIGIVGDGLARKKEEYCSKGRLSGRRNAIGKKVMQREEEEKEAKRDGSEKEEKNGDFELCRMRILMGEKCKPLNVSGTLRYDENGILLPEEIWTKDG